MVLATFSVVALDCPDPGALAEFYRSILGGEIVRSDDEWVRLRVPGATDIGFQRVLDHQPPEWPDGSPQQAHLDFDVPDLDAAERAVLVLGAVKADTQPTPDEWRVFIDPAGHPFCLCLASS